MITRSLISAAPSVAKLRDAVDFLDSMRRPVTESDRRVGPYPYYGANGQQGTIDAYLFDEPLILLAEDGGRFGEPDRGIAYRISGKTWVNNHAHVLRAKSDFDINFLCRVLENYDVTPWVTGTTRGKLTQASASEILVPRPPLPEQRRIAEILDKADALRAKRRACLAQLNTLTQSIFLDMFGDPATNRNRWSKLTLGEVATFVGGGTPSRDNPEFFTGSICWATSKDMRAEFLDDTEEHITEDAIKNSATKVVPAGTILIVVKSKVLAHRLPVAIARVATCFGQDLKGVQVGPRCEVSFVAASLRIGSQLLLKSARGINTEGLTLEHLRAFPLVLPPLGLQSEFARRIDAVLNVKAKLTASLTQLESAFASLQHRAFRGEL